MNLADSWGWSGGPCVHPPPQTSESFCWSHLACALLVGHTSQGEGCRGEGPGSSPRPSWCFAWPSRTLGPRTL